MALRPSVAIRRLRRGWGPTDWITVQVPREEVPFVVPIEAWSGYVGPAFMRELAERLQADFTRDPADIGLMDDFSVLNGPSFDAERVHPQIREFYEHTSRFVLSVIPDWHRRWLPLFWLFRTYFLRHVGQFNLPFDEREERNGIETHIDALDLNHDRIVDLRGWVRTYAGTDTAIYVGIYTAVKLDGVGYVSVGFPLPNANLTATLVPVNVDEHDLLLRTKEKGARYVGDYIVLVDEISGGLSVFRIRGLREDIHVYVRDGGLYTDHRFYFLTRNFLTLHYTITPSPEPAEPQRTAALLEQAAGEIAQHGNPVAR